MTSWCGSCQHCTHWLNAYDPDSSPSAPLAWRRDFAEARNRLREWGPGVPVTSTETFRRLDGGYFLVQEYDTTFGDEPTQRGVAYWGYDAEAGRFLIVFFSNNGPFTEEGNRYQGTVTDGNLTFVGPARYQYELDKNGKIKTNADGTISVAWWLRDESGEWKPWMHNTFRKIRD